MAMKSDAYWIVKMLFDVDKLSWMQNDSKTDATNTTEIYVINNYH